MDEQQQKQAQLDQLTSAWLGNQLMQLAKCQIEIDSLRAQLATAQADLRGSPRAFPPDGGLITTVP